MLILQWAYDEQDSSCNSVVGNPESILSLYGILFGENRNKLSYIMIKYIDGSLYKNYSFIEDSSE